MNGCLNLKNGRKAFHLPSDDFVSGPFKCGVLIGICFFPVLSLMSCFVEFDNGQDVKILIAYYEIGTFTADLVEPSLPVFAFLDFYQLGNLYLPQNDQPWQSLNKSMEQDLFDFGKWLFPIEVGQLKNFFFTALNLVCVLNIKAFLIRKTASGIIVKACRFIDAESLEVVSPQQAVASLSPLDQLRDNKKSTPIKNSTITLPIKSLIFQPF